jgi:hypothetical protein
MDSIDVYLMCISIIIRAYICIKFPGESFRLVKITAVRIFDDVSYYVCLHKAVHITRRKSVY